MPDTTKSSDDSPLTIDKTNMLADVITEAFVCQAKIQNMPFAGQRNQKTPTMLGVTGIMLSSGLEVRHVPRSKAQQAGSGILLKHDHTNREVICLKRKGKGVVTLPDKLVCNNVLSINPSEDIGNMVLRLVVSSGRLDSEDS